MSSRRLMFAGLFFSLTMIASHGRAQEAKDPALERGRKQILMLDTLYKTAIVTVTDKYVHSEKDIAAATSFSAVFNAMKKGGFHEARLLDATGEPYNDANLPKDAFEKEAIKQLKAGKASHEQVESTPEGRVLRTATIIPVVMKKCTLCHEVYKKAADGAAIGAISYKLKLE